MPTTNDSRPSRQSLAVGLFLASAFSAISVYLNAQNSSAFDRLTREDGLFEWATAAFYLLAAILFVVASRGLRIGRIWLLGMGFMCFVVAGEEVSWLQRVFGFGTPEVLEETNVQAEFNLHNLDGITQNIRLFGLLIVLTVFVGIPLTHRLLASVRDFYNRLEVPISSADALAWVVLAIAFMATPRLLGRGSDFGLDEAGETLLSVAFVLFGWSQAVKSKRRLTGHVGTRESATHDAARQSQSA